MAFVAFIVLSIAPQIVAQNTIENSGNMQMHPGAQMAFFGNLTNNGTFNNNLGAAFFSGSALQTIAGTNLINFKDVSINNSSNVKLDQELQISGTFLFSAGKLFSDRTDIATEYVHFLDNSTYSGSNANRFIDGVARKTGDDAFTFPLGNDTAWARLGISAPSLISDAFTATYYNTAYANTTTMATSPSPVLNNVSVLQHWICDRSIGTSNVTVQLHWDDSASRFGINSFTSDLVVARWNGTAWENAGQSAITPGVTTGDVTSATVSSFSPFTFGSLSSSLNPLPILLISFKAKVINSDKVQLSWETASEINNDYFVVERSKNTALWEELAEIDGAGNSSQITAYSAIDNNPYQGISYYRLKQVDFDGQYSYSSIRAVKLDGLENVTVKIYPTPTQNQITIESSFLEIEELQVYNMLGQDVSSYIELIESNERSIVISLTNLPQGIYTIKTKSTVNKVLKQ